MRQVELKRTRAVTGGRGRAGAAVSALLSPHELAFQTLLACPSFGQKSVGPSTYEGTKMRVVPQSAMRQDPIRTIPHAPCCELILKILFPMNFVIPSGLIPRRKSFQVLWSHANDAHPHMGSGPVVYFFFPAKGGR